VVRKKKKQPEKAQAVKSNDKVVIVDADYGETVDDPPADEEPAAAPVPETKPATPAKKTTGQTAKPPPKKK